jgi:predicted membrane protein
VKLKISKILTITGIAISISIVISWLYLFKIPAYKAEKFANNFEKSVRNNDKAAVKRIISNSIFWSDVVFPRFQLFQNEFSKFYENVEIYKAIFHSGTFW